MTAPKFITMKGSSHLTDKPFYVGLVQHESVMTRKETYAHLAAKLKFSEANIRAAFRAFAEFAALEKDGAVRINFDGGSVSQVIKGTFLSSDAAFDEKRNSLELAWHLSEDVRHHLVNETPRIVTDVTSTKVRLDTVADLETPRPYQVIHGRKPFKCTGINLVMSDVGAEIYLEDATGVRHQCEVVELITDTNSFAQHSDTSIAFPPAFWDKFPAANSDVTFTLTTQKGAAIHIH